MNTDKQLLIIEYFLSSNDIFNKCQHIIEPSFFDKGLQKAVKFIKEYHVEYRALPTVHQVLAESGQQLSLRPVTRHEQEYVEHEIETFCKHKALETAILAAPELIAKSDIFTLEKNIKAAITMGLHKELGTEFFSDADNWLTKLAENNTMISTGWSNFDKTLGGGLNRQELLLFSAASGGGKSLVMANIAVNYVQQGLNVLYITLELSEPVVSKRLASMVTGIAQTDIVKNKNSVLKKIKEKMEHYGKLTVKRFPESATSCNDLRAYLKEMELVNGYVPDVIIVDYLDIMIPSSKFSADNTFLKEKMIAEELRRLAFETDSIMITASQLNRSGMGANGMDNINSTVMAGGISKTYTADNSVAILLDENLRNQQKALMKFMKTRSSAGAGTVLSFTFDPISLRITDDSGTAPLSNIVSRIAKGKNPVEETQVVEEVKKTGKQVNLLGIMD